MTRDEFLEQRHQMPCPACGHEGLEPDHNANNGGMRAACPSCRWRGQWLPKAAIKRPSRAPVDTLEVWTSNGDHCAFCGKSRALCEQLGIGRTAQHIVPFYKGGDAWPLVPFCARCQQASAAALAETRRVEETVVSLSEIIARIEKHNPELLA